MGFFYQMARTCFKITLNTFFKDIEVVGIENIPKEGPVIICGNHNNQFIDAMLIMKEMPRETSFIMAAKSVNRKVVGTLARMVNVITVERPQDLAFEGKGLATALKNNTLYGKNTQFKKELKVGDSLVVNSTKSSFLVKEIISDEELKVVPNAANPADMELKDSKFKNFPKLNQSQMFDNVHKHLRDGNCIGIFPEGGSHDRTELIELKAGVSIMALGTWAKFGTKVKIVTIGLNYYSANEFRSKLIMDIGKAYEIPEEILQLHKTDKKKAVKLLLAEIENRMKSCLITASSYSNLSAIFTIRSIYKPDNYKLTAEQEFILNRRFALAIDYLKNHPEIESLLKRVTEYNKKLKTLGIKDEEVPHLHKKYVKDILSIIKSFSLFCFNSAFALPGIVITGPLAGICQILGEKERKRALKGSSIKVRGIDVVASYKLVCGYILFPLASLGLTSAFYLWTKYMMFPPGTGKLMSCGFFILWPLYISVMVRSVDEAYKHSRMLKSKLSAYIFSSQYDGIKKERLDLKKTIMDAVDTLGPKAFPENFEQGRVIAREYIVKDVNREVKKVYHDERKDDKN